MLACWEQDQHDFMNERIPLFKWLKIKPLVNVVPSPSLLYLAPYIIDDGHDVHYLEGLFFTFENVMDRLSVLQPDVIGVTLTSVDWENSRWMITEMKKLFSDAIVVVGGIHPTLWQERCFQECDGIDYVVKGEGEYTMRELLNCLQKKEIPLEVPGLVFFHEGQLVKTPDRETVEDIDSLPMPAHQLAPPDKYLPSPTFYNRLPHANIIGARGCPYLCTFCHTDRHVRMRSAANIADEIEWLVKEQGIKDIAFWDDTFTLSEKRALEFCDEILRRGLDVDWAVHSFHGQPRTAGLL